MATRLAALLPRFVALTVIILSATAALTFAADKRTVATSAAADRAAAIAPVLATLTVPDVQRQAYVFGEGILEDHGFAWRVQGPVGGYAANTVVSQTPAPGVTVVDTGAPLIILRLARNSAYAEHGAPQNASSYPATPLRFISANGTAAPLAPAAPTPLLASPSLKHTAKGAPSPAVPRAARVRQAAPAAQTGRPVAFRAVGAPKEPLDEIPLPDRARLLSTWLTQHAQPTNANVRHWLYQNAWIVTGARFGWWHGAEALKLLIAADRRAELAWGIGGKSEAVARAALAEVGTRSR